MQRTWLTRRPWCSAIQAPQHDGRNQHGDRPNNDPQTLLSGRVLLLFRVSFFLAKRGRGRGRSAPCSLSLRYLRATSSVGLGRLGLGLRQLGRHLPQPTDRRP